MIDSSNPAKWAGYTAPEGMLLAWRAVYPDGRSSNDFYWPFKGVARVLKRGIIRDNTSACPASIGDGLCLAKTWEGAASDDIPLITGLAVAYSPEDILGEDQHKLRVSRCRVLGALDIPRLLREGHGHEADLHGADFPGANLRGADLHGTYLPGANLRGASLYGADLHGASLSGANLGGASLCAADLCGTDLRLANLRGTNLSRANLQGANFYGAYLDPDLDGLIGVAK